MHHYASLLAISFFAGASLLRMGMNTIGQTQSSNMMAVVEEQQQTQQVPMGSLGPTGSGREHLKYYDMIYYSAKEFASDARSVLEVGCTADPFIKHLDWIPQKQCVAPYSAYGEDTNVESVERIVADFAEWEMPEKEDGSENDRYDLLICSQVVEHIKDAESFVQKFFDVADTIIFSVPHRWRPTVDHKHHYIDIKTIEKWASPHTPIASSIVKDGKLERIIVVFKSEEATETKLRRRR